MTGEGGWWDGRAMAAEALSEDRGGFSEESEWGSREVTGGRSRRRRKRSGVQVKRGTKKGRELKRGTLFRKVGEGWTDGWMEGEDGAGLKASAAAGASAAESWSEPPLNILSRSYQRPREMRYWQELLSALTAEQVNRVGRQATG